VETTTNLRPADADDSKSGTHTIEHLVDALADSGRVAAASQFSKFAAQIRRIRLLANHNSAVGRMYVCSLRTLVAFRAGVSGFLRLDLENGRRYRAMASMCRLRATFGPGNGW
jgi:hypothetical protein